MRFFHKVFEGLDTGPMLTDLEGAPDLWDAFNERRTAPGSPHGEMEDIWVRARARDDLTNPEAFRLPHNPVFYPAWQRLPSIQPVVWSLMQMTKAVQLGNVLITRIRPGHQVYAHADNGWAPEWFTTKFYVVLQGNSAVVNYCGEVGDEERVVMGAGSIWQFENLVRHGISNHGDTDRISLIVTVRVEH